MSQSLKAEMGVMLFITRPTPPPVGGGDEDDFWKTPKDGDWVSGEPNTNGGSDLSVPPPDFQGGEPITTGQ